jgi:hypothetical protein
LTYKRYRGIAGTASAIKRYAALQLPQTDQWTARPPDFAYFRVRCEHLRNPAPIVLK